MTSTNKFQILLMLMSNYILKRKHNHNLYYLLKHHLYKFFIKNFKT